MQIKDVIKKNEKRLKVILSNLNNKQKLLLAIAFALLMVFIVNILIGSNSRRLGESIDYKNISGENLYTFSNIIEDENIYVTIKSISDDFISTCLGYKKNEDNEKINSDEIYNTFLENEYKKNISKGKFEKEVEELVSNVKKVNENNFSLIPKNITEYKENYYLVKYEFKFDEELLEIYIGIMLDDIDKQYYIWYLE